MVFKRLPDDQQQDYERLARLEHGPDLVNESVGRWNDYTPAQQDAIIAEGNAIYAEIAGALRQGTPANDPDVQALLARWHQHLRHFYEPSLDLLAGLGELYATSPDFRANFEKLHPDLPEYLREAVAEYVDALETALLEQMLHEDEARRKRLEG